jgi:hypothetical protein
MTGSSINTKKLNRKRIALNLRCDERGYFWETESGEDTDARYSSTQDAIADLITLWNTDAEDCPPQALNQSGKQKIKEQEMICRVW